MNDYDIAVAMAKESPLALAHVNAPSIRPFAHLTRVDDALRAISAGDLKRLIVQMPPQHGKRLANVTPILTPEGWKNHGDLKVGDDVFHPSGHRIKVIATNDPGPCDMVVTFSNGQQIQCHNEHEWTVICRTNGNRIKTFETGELFNLNLRQGPTGRGGRWRYQVPFVECLDFDYKPLKLDPYCLGAWLGDGKTAAPIIYSASGENEVVDYFTEQYGVSSRDVHNVTAVVATRFSKSLFGFGLDIYNLIGNKHIPAQFLTSNKEQRLQLLAGLIDTDGSLHKPTGQYRFINTNKRLIDETCDLIASLGYTYSLTSADPRPEPNSSGIQDRQVCYQIGFTPFDQIPCKIPRKQSTKKPKRRRVTIVDVRPIPVADQLPGNCIQVDSPDGLYLAGRKMVPTHNSELVSRTFPAHHLDKRPDDRVACASYATSLSKMASRANRALVDRWGLNGAGLLDIKVKYDTRSAGEWEVDGHRGGVLAVSVDSGFNGRPADVIVIDDPIKDYKNALNKTNRDDIWNWYTSVALLRISERGAIILVQTRWNSDDLAGRILNSPGGNDWELISLPGINDQGEALCPQMHSLAQLEEFRATIGAYKWSCLYQQKPIQPDECKFPPSLFDQVFDWAQSTPTDEFGWPDINGHRVVTVDKSWGGDFTAIVEMFVPINRNGRVYVRVNLFRTSDPDILARNVAKVILEGGKKYPELVWIEETLYKGEDYGDMTLKVREIVNASGVMLDHLIKGVSNTYHGLESRPKGELKTHRIMSLYPVLSRGKMHFIDTPGARTAISQFIDFKPVRNKGYDDAIDCISRCFECLSYLLRPRR